uniref:Ubiquitin-like protease family profile domain-containing protein n=1 Tax=Amphimedon queenslandica TaxID=400682 RepID=A0A1X7TST8_AMPQE
LSLSIPLRAKEQIASLIFCDNKEINIDIPDVQKQQRGSDCGLFALAFTTSLCANNSPSEISYIQCQFRSHL